MLKLFYGWTDVNVPGVERSYGERQVLFEKVGALKKWSIEEVERNLQTETQIELENKRTKEDWQALVKNDNQRAKTLVEAAASGDTGALCELQQYRQCGNCAHVSHSDQTHQGHALTADELASMLTVSRITMFQAGKGWQNTVVPHRRLCTV